MGIFRTNNLLAGATAVAALILSGCSGGVTATSAPSTSVQPLPNAQNLEQAFVSVVQRVLPSVAQITTDRALGSGIVFDTQGNIVTNAHVVAGTTFTVTFSDGKTQPATLVGSFAPDDLAVVHVSGSTPAPARFADSVKLVVGDIALAV